MKLHFFGGAGGVTGSNTLVEVGGKQILVDCGLFQGRGEEKNWQPFGFDPKKIDAVVVTHAHLDHCGRLPKLVGEGFKGPIYVTEATRDLIGVQLVDAVEVIAQRALEHRRPTLYSTNDVIATLTKIRPIPYGKTIAITPDVRLTLNDAGHILGSATVSLKAQGKTIVFSGDLGNSPVPILNPPTALSVADVLVMEATYGDRLHPVDRDRVKDLATAIKDTIARRGVLLIPCFAVERTQEILYELNNLVEHKKVPPVPIFLDSPLAIDVTRVFRSHVDDYNAATRTQIRSGDDPFSFPHLTLTHTVTESKRINQLPAPKVIIAGSGMMEGGRIVHHLVRYLGDDRTILLVVGYQVEGTLGRAIVDGERLVTVLDERVRVRAEVRQLPEFSGHADQAQLLRWIGAFRTHPKIYLNHAEPASARVLAARLGGLGLTATVVREGEVATI